MQFKAHLLTVLRSFVYIVTADVSVSFALRVHTGVDRAVHALNELCSKGYSTLLAAPDFHEGYVEVKPK
jgi:hypothetical protein